MKINLSKLTEIDGLSMESKFRNIATGFLVMLIVNVIVGCTYEYLFAAEVIRVMPPEYIVIWHHPLLIQLFIAVICAPIGEELVYRHLPLRLLKSFGKEDVLWPVILGISILFAWVHPGYSGDGHASIFMQGIGGIIFSIVYIKNNNCVVSTMILHAIWNLLITLSII